MWQVDFVREEDDTAGDTVFELLKQATDAANEGELGMAGLLLGASIAWRFAELISEIEEINESVDHVCWHLDRMHI